MTPTRPASAHPASALGRFGPGTPRLGPVARGLVVAVLAGASLLAAGCGGYHDGPYYDPYYPYPPGPVYGAVEVDNRTDSTTFEYTETFFLAPAGTGLFTGNLLSGPLPPGYVEDVGDFVEDWYDAEADLEFGDVVTWFDVAVVGGDVTTFEVF